MKSFIHLIGVPYEKKNCFEIVRSFYKDILEIELKQYMEEVAANRFEARDLIYTNIGDFKKVNSKFYKVGDLLLMKIQGVESHIAVVVGPNQILHSLKNTGSVLDRTIRWKNCITGAYRLRGVDDKD